MSFGAELDKNNQRKAASSCCAFVSVSAAPAQRLHQLMVSASLAVVRTAVICWARVEIELLRNTICLAWRGYSGYLELIGVLMAPVLQWGEAGTREPRELHKGKCVEDAGELLASGSFSERENESMSNGALAWFCLSRQLLEDLERPVTLPCSWLCSVAELPAEPNLGCNESWLGKVMVFWGCAAAPVSPMLNLGKLQS